MSTQPYDTVVTNKHHSSTQSYIAVIPFMVMS